MTTKAAAEEAFYKTIGDEVGAGFCRAQKGQHVGFFMPQELALITNAYAVYLHGGGAVGNAVQLESESRESTSERERDEDEQRAYCIRLVISIKIVTTPAMV